MPDVHVPLLGNIPKKGLVIGVGGGVLVVGYLLYRKHAETTAAGADTATGYGYGASAYGYGTGMPGYYGYGSALGPSPYAYGYGGYGYGGFGGSSGAYGYGSPPPTWYTTPPPWLTKPPKNTKPGTSVVTAQGNMDLYRLARLEGISLGKLLRLNPHLKKYEGTGKHIPKGIKVKI